MTGSDVSRPQRGGSEPDNGQSFAVLTGIGPDRVGIVDSITAVIERFGGSIADSRMAVLGGEFAILVLLSAPQEQIHKLISQVDSIADEVSLSIEVKPTEAPSHTSRGRPYIVESFSLDAPGIVHAVSGVLHSFGINIEDLETDLSAAPWTGAPMFYMQAHVLIPPSVSVTTVRERLAELEHERDLDIQLKPVAIG